MTQIITTLLIIMTMTALAMAYAYDKDLPTLGRNAFILWLASIAGIIVNVIILAVK